MLPSMGNYNQLSDGLRKDLETRAKAAGRIVTYRFDIAKLNPDGEQKTGGEYLYPAIWTLTPVTYDIVDQHDNKRKKIGLPITLNDEKGGEDHFTRLLIKEGNQGMYRLDLKNADDMDMFAFLEMHPKIENGMFKDQQAKAVFRRIDLAREAKVKVDGGKAKVNALLVASGMDEYHLKDFASAMGWDENEDMDILRARMLELAETDYKFFIDFIDNKNIEFRAILKRGFDNNIISWIPVENKIIWSNTSIVIALLDRVEGDKLLERLTDWVITSKNGMEVFNKIKSLLNKKEKVS